MKKICRFSFHFYKIEISLYKPVIFTRIKYKIPRVPKKIIGRIKRNFLILNKFLNGAIIIKIKPIRLLIKNLG